MQGTDTAQNIVLAQWAQAAKPSILQRMLALAVQPGILSFAIGLPAAELFPVQAYALAVASVLANDVQALQYGAPEQALKRQLEPDTISYPMPAAFRLSGSLSVEIFDRCLQVMEQRHESLRTTFEVRSEQPVQVIHRCIHVDISVIDLVGVDESKKSLEIFHWINEATLHALLAQR